jgi:5-formyltetrahydrofolate cyclo-ligase
MTDRQSPRRALRAELRAAREASVAGLAGPVRAALAAALAERILAHLPRQPGILGVHAAMGSEIDPAAAAGKAAARGWTLAFPRVRGAAPLAFHAARPESLVPGFKGIPEPEALLPEVRPDVLLVPLLAADPEGRRLGQGGGHYDRTLAALRAHGPLLAIGIAWDMQILPHLDAMPHDEPLDAVATPTRFLWARPAPR